MADSNILPNGDVVVRLRFKAEHVPSIQKFLATQRIQKVDGDYTKIGPMYPNGIQDWATRLVAGNVASILTSFPPDSISALQEELRLKQAELDTHLQSAVDLDGDGVPDTV
jgi:hypothetical protein